MSEESVGEGRTEDEAEKMGCARVDYVPAFVHLRTCVCVRVYERGREGVCVIVCLYVYVWCACACVRQGGCER